MPPVTTYEVYENGAISGRTFYVWDTTQQIISGSTTLSRPYDFLCSPNTVPGVSIPTPASQGFPNQGWCAAGYDDGVSSKVTIRYFLRKFTVKIEWTDGSETIPLVGRATLVNAPVGQGWTIFGNSLVVADPIPQGFDIFFADGLSLDYGLTDTDGIFTYYGLLGIAIGIPDVSNPLLTDWTLLNPSTATGGQHFQNISVGVNQAEYLQQMAFSQWVGPLNTDGPNTAGWSIDYGAAWHSSTGMLDSPDPALVTFQYHQGVFSINIQDANGSDIPADLTLSPYPHPGRPSYTGVTGSIINMVPNGSLLQNVRAEPSDPVPLPSLTVLPVLDIGLYSDPGSSVTDPLLNSPAAAELIPTNWGLSEFGVPMDYLLQWTGIAGSTLTGVTGPGFEILLNYIGPVQITKEQFTGGEVVTLPYIVMWKEQAGGKGRSGTFFVFIHEDRYDTIGFQYLPKTATGELDYARDPRSDPFLTEGRSDSAFQTITPDMETTFQETKILTEGVGSPSRCVMADHEHLLAGIDGNGHAKLWHSLDEVTWSVIGVIDSSATWAGVCLRTDAGDSLHLWLVSSAGAVSKRLSVDGGSTFSSLAAVSSLPPCAAEKIDCRFTGSDWVAAIPAATGAIELYSSSTGDDDWVHEVQVAAAGTEPVLLQIDPGRDWLVVYLTATQISSRRVSDTGGSWTVGSEILVTSTPTVPAAYRDPQHGFCAFKIPLGTIQFSQTLNDGDTWVLQPENEMVLNSANLQVMVRALSFATFGSVSGGGVIAGSYTGSILSTAADLNLPVAANQSVVGQLIIASAPFTWPLPDSSVLDIYLVDDGTIAYVLTGDPNPGSPADPAIFLGTATTAGGAITTITGSPTLLPAVQGDLAFDAPLSETSDVVSIPAADTSTDGYLTHTDWNTFNGKLSSESDPLSLHTAGGTMTGPINSQGISPSATATYTLGDASHVWTSVYANSFLGSVNGPTVQAQDFYILGTSTVNIISNGSGAPVAGGATPGDIYIDYTGGQLYMWTGAAWGMFAHVP